MQENMISAMDVAVEAGRLLLESGGEISRVQDTVLRIARHYGAMDFQVYVISNGLFASACENGRETRAAIRHVPITAPHFGRLIAVNQLSREITQGLYTISEAYARLREAAVLPCKPAWQQITASAVGSASFCYLFGGGLRDSLCACVAGALVYVFLLFAGKRGFSRISSFTLSSALVTLLGLGLYFYGPGEQLSKIIIGSIIPLLPGVAFTTSIRDYLNGDNLSGTIHMTDALITGMCIAVGVGTILLGAQRFLGVSLA